MSAPTATNLLAKAMTPETWRVQGPSNLLWIERERSRGWKCAACDRGLVALRRPSAPFIEGFEAFRRKRATEDTAS